MKSICFNYKITLINIQDSCMKKPSVKSFICKKKKWLFHPTDNDCFITKLLFTIYNLQYIDVYHI